MSEFPKVRPFLTQEYIDRQSKKSMNSFLLQKKEFDEYTRLGAWRYALSHYRRFLLLLRGRTPKNPVLKSIKPIEPTTQPQEEGAAPNKMTITFTSFTAFPAETKDSDDGDEFRMYAHNQRIFKLIGMLKHRVANNVSREAIKRDIEEIKREVVACCRSYDKIIEKLQAAEKS